MQVKNYDKCHRSCDIIPLLTFHKWNDYSILLLKSLSSISVTF